MQCPLLEFAPYLSVQCCGAAAFLCAPGKIFDAAPALAPTLLNNKAEFLKRFKFKQILKLFCSFDSVRFILYKYELNGL
jgi:hypothetical protein